MFAYEVPPPGNVLYLPVVRLAGTTGRLMVYWEAQVVIATTADFTPSSGNLTFQDGQVYISISSNTLHFDLQSVCIVFIDIYFVMYKIQRNLICPILLHLYCLCRQAP